MTHDPRRMDGYDERLVDYVYGELSAARVREVEARLERDPAARAEVASLRAVRTAFSALPDAQPSPKVTYDILREARVAAADRAARQKPALGWRLPRLIMHPAFASVCVLVLVSGAILSLQKTGADRPTSPIAEDEALGVFAAAAPRVDGAKPEAEPEAKAKPKAEEGSVTAALAGGGKSKIERNERAQLRDGDVADQAPVAAAEPAATAASGPLAGLEARNKRKGILDALQKAPDSNRLKAPAKPRGRATKTPQREARPADFGDLGAAKAGKKAEAPSTTAFSRGRGGGSSAYSSGGDAPAKDTLAFAGEEDAWAQAPPEERQTASDGLDLDELMAAEIGYGSAGNVAQRAAPPAGQAQAPAQGALHGLTRGDAEISTSSAAKTAPAVAGGVRSAPPHQDLGSRALRLKINDLDRLPAGRRWAESLAEVARSEDRSAGVGRIRRSLLQMSARRRADYARYVKEQIRILEGEGHLAAAAQLRELLEHLDFEEAKEGLAASDDYAAEPALENVDAAELEIGRDEKAAKKADTYRRLLGDKRKKAKVRMLKKSRSAPVQADDLQMQEADEKPTPSSTAF